MRGRVLDDEGHPLVSATVRRIGPDGRTDAIVAADAEGRFTVLLDPAAGLVKLHVGGLDRKSETFVVTTDTLPIDVVVKLGSYEEIPAKIEDVEVIVFADRSAGGIRGPKPVPGGIAVEPHKPDGRYRFLLATADEEEHILADGIFEVKDGKAVAPFDRVHVPPPGRRGSVELPAGSASRAVNEVIALATTEIARAAKERPKGAPAFSWSALREATARVAATDLRPRVRSAALVAYFTGGAFAAPTPEDQGRALSLVKTVPPTDALWSIGAIPTMSGATNPFESVVDVAGESLDDPFVCGFLSGQPNVAVVADFLYREMVRAKGSPERQRIIMQQSRAPRLIDNPYAKALAAFDPDRPVSAGKAAPVVDVAALDGKGHVGSASFEGKPYLVDFWSTSCGPCVREQPLLHDLYARYGKAGKLGMLSIAADEELATIVKFRGDAAHPMPWKHGIVNRAETFALFEKLGGKPSFPFHLLVDAKGVIVDASPTLRTGDLEAAVARAVKESTGTTTR